MATTDRPDTGQEERWVRPFADVLHDIRRGAAHDEASEALAEVVAAVAEHRKPGKVTVTVDIKPYANVAEALAVDVQIKSTVPEADHDATLMFADERGVLSRDNPNQPSIPGLRDVSASDRNEDKPEEASS